MFLGSDYPYDMGMLDCVRHVRSLDISANDRDTILGGHAAAIVGKTRSRRRRGDAPWMMPASCACLHVARHHSLIKDAFVAAGLPEADAARCAELMTEADLTGADGHGVFRLPQYVRRLKAGGFNKHPNITVTSTAPATALVDGDNGMGHLVMSRAANEAIAIAREHGVSWVGVRRSTTRGRPASMRRCRPRRA